MVNINLSDKLKLDQELSDLKVFKVNRVFFLLSIFLVSLVTWALTAFMMKVVLHSTHVLVSSITPDKIISSNNLLFVAIIVFFASVRSALYQLNCFKDSFGNGVSEALASFQRTHDNTKSEKSILQNTYKLSSFFKTIKRVLVTIMTLGVGGSGGIAGPAIPVGLYIGAGFAKLFGVRNLLWLRILEMCGISAAITTLLHAPLTGAVFALELVFGCKFVYRLLTCALVSSLVAYILTNNILEAKSLFDIHEHAIRYGAYEYMTVALVSIVVSIPSGIGISLIFHLIHKAFSYLPVILRVPIGAFLCASIAILMSFYFGLDPIHILGVGEETVTRFFAPTTPDPALNSWKMLLVIVILKIFLTGFTIISGGSAGLLVPAIFIGAASSRSLFLLLSSYHLLPATEGLLALLMVTGIASSLIFVMDLPIAAVLFVGELFDASFIPPCIVAVAISHVLSRHLKQYFPLH